MARQVLVTGATGMVGYSIVQALLARGERVRVLVRSPDKARALLPPACELAPGDVTAPDSLRAAVAGCEWVFHAAGFPEQWLRDATVFERVNADGTAHMLAAARAAGVGRFVFTSTIDVFTWRPGATYDESEIDPAPKATAYERSKQRADRLVAEAVAGGLDAVFLHPSAVYGPAPSDSPGINDLIGKLARREVPALLPGGFPVVFAADVGEGHVRAAERAAAGARFILSERYHSLVEVAGEILALLGAGGRPRVMPLWLAAAVAVAGEAWARISGSPPLIPRGQLQFMQVDAVPSAARAASELDLQFVPLREGLTRTIAWLRDSGRLPAAGAAR